MAMKNKHGRRTIIVAIVLFLAAIATKYLCVLHLWDAKGLDMFLVMVSLVLSGVGAGILVTLDINKDNG
jgi:hypothetical protein